MKNKKIIGDVSIPFKWEQKSWPDALLRIRATAKAYEESNQRSEIKACFNIAHTVSSETEIDWEESIDASPKFKKDRVKDSTWRSKYHAVFKNVIKATRESSKVPLNSEKFARLHLSNGNKEHRQEDRCV